MKRLLTLCTMLCIAVATMAQSEQPLPKMFAHRGCWSKICPENSLPAVARAARHGYLGIECDVKMTSDGKMVIMHDKTINRTCRNAEDYSKIQGKVKIEDLTFKELRNNYVLESPNKEYRMQVPTLEELLKECNPADIKVATLLFKPESLKCDVTIDYVALDIPPAFIVGYGLDYDELGRNLKDIYSIVQD